jgi:endonuclease/exonuclease/phosphatase family metal-dependent hydrolase
MGKNAEKGLAVIVPRGYEVERLEANESLIYFLPLQTGGLFLISAWAFNGRAKRFGLSCSGYLADALPLYDHKIASNSKVIIAGDLNNGPRWDRKNFHRNNFRYINCELNERGLVSAYHSHLNESFGDEKIPTHYHHRSLFKPFHIDYVFTKGFKVSNVSVGDFETWIGYSDHMPLIVDLGFKDMK